MTHVQGGPDRAELSLFLAHLRERSGALLQGLTDARLDRLSVEQWVGDLRLSHFGAGELLYAVDREGNGPPPRELWGNIVPTIVLLDALREYLDEPLRITSCYRAPAYNRVVGGTTRSQHQAWSAIDFAAAHTAPEILGEILRAWRGRLLRLPVDLPRRRLTVPGGELPFADLPTWRGGDGDRPAVVEWHGGVGVYATFVHVDSRGLDHSWSG